MIVIEPIEIKYRALPMIGGMALFAGGSAWILFGPETHGFVGQLLGSTGRLSIAGLAATGCTLGVACLFSFYAIRLALGRPALSAANGELRVNLAPFQTFLLHNLADVKIDGENLLIVPKSGRTRKVRLAILDHCEAAVEQMSAECRGLPDHLQVESSLA